jgi:hypothetical protein
MEFTRALDDMIREVRSGDLARVQRCADLLEPRNVRPVLESAVCIGFRDGASQAVLTWMADRVGTLRVVRRPYGAMSLTRVVVPGVPRSRR